MKKFITTSFFLFILLAALTGCETVSVRYEPLENAKVCAPYPFKFYLEKVRFDLHHVGIDHEVNKYPVFIQWGEELKSELIKANPQYFTDDSRGVPACEIVLSKEEKNSTPLVTLIGGVFSLFSLGLIPSTEDIDFQWKISIETCGMQITRKASGKERHAATIGILGGILQTHRLVSPVGGYHLKEVSPKTRYFHPQVSQFHEQLICVLNMLNRDKIMEYYNTRFTEKTELLE